MNNDLDSSHPVWNISQSAPSSSNGLGHGPSDQLDNERKNEEEGMHVNVPPESMPLPPDVVWGPLVFEARKFVEMRKKSFSGACLEFKHSLFL
jgi:hypothetical protein